MIKNKKTLVAFALIISLILCVELFLNGFAYLNAKFHPTVNSTDFDSLYIRIGVWYLFLNIIYLVWLSQNKRCIQSPNFLNILKITSAFILIAFMSYPISTDIYLYLHYGLMDLNGINPFVNTAGSFKSQLYPLLSWSQTSTYGPISQFLFAISAYFTSISIYFGVYIFKLFCLIVHIVNGYLIWRQLKCSQHQTKLTIAYLLNPVILFEQVTNAHLDVFICTSLIILIIGLKQYRYVLSVSATLVGFLIKTIPIVWLPLLFVFLAKRKHWKSLIIGTILFIAIVVTLSLTVFPTSKAWLSLLNPGVGLQTANSLHNILTSIVKNIERLLQNSANHPYGITNLTTSAFKILTYLIFIIYYLWILFKIYFRQKYSQTNLILDIGWTTLVLFLFATPWLMPWYCSILLPIVALYASSWLFVLTSLTFCISSISSYLLVYPNAPGLFYLLSSIITVVPTILLLLLRTKLLQSIPHPWYVREF
jgi:alpha-1,6-mannosyltransferase